MRLYTHTDFDGVVSAVFLVEVEEIDEILFIDPANIQSGRVQITKFDILADLPYDKRCGMWFDHHESNKPKEGTKFAGLWKIAPSCAQVIYDWADNPYLDKYKELLSEVNKIDSGQVPLDEAKNPKGWFLLSNTLETSAPKKEDDDYRRHVIELIRKNPDIHSILSDERVAKRSQKVFSDLEILKDILLNNTKIIGKVAYSDLRQVENIPRGNNYFIYSLFPDVLASVRLLPGEEDGVHIKISAGHNVYGAKSNFNIGKAMKEMGGGGHFAVGGAKVRKEEAEKLAMDLIKKINESA
ncbi:MAG: hypothetical protein N3G80_01945 [Candidatus Micrarchaeota archaeon]|nr:hypothetical protein [Candidatus Micrarchaeota archaeon]